jgi:uncharacterized membrane protein YidH (DUF202 family)
MKNKLILPITLVIIIGIFIPFTFSDEMTYVKKGTQSIYVPYTYIWLMISTTLLIFFSCLGVLFLVEKILENIKD